jgi:thiamine-monophosphate kinase
MPKLHELGEQFLIKYLLEKTFADESAALPPGDDAAALWFNGMLVTSVDTLVWETDVPQGLTWFEAGWKAVASAVSDIAAKGATPRYLLVSLGLNPAMEFSDFEELVEGVGQSCRHHGASVIGGDLSRQSSPTATVTVIGSADKVIPRNGARPGDILATTGLFGKTYTGLHAIISGKTADEELLQSIRRPMARVLEGRLLSESGAVTACVDSSDGLAESIHLLAEASGVGFVVEEIPVDSIAEEYCRRNGLDVLEAVFYGGEEYELVFTVKPGWESFLKQLFEGRGLRTYFIGRAVEKPGVVVKSRGFERVLERRGWDVFQTRPASSR